VETNAKDAKCESARWDAAGDSRVIYAPRPDATPEGELAALTATYAFVIQAHERKKAVAPATRRQKEVDPEERRQGQEQ
jgi:hypothetical protein